MFETKKVVTFALGESYRGPTATLQLEFPFVFPTLPGLSAIDQLDLTVRAALFSADILQLVKDNYLGYQLAVDTKPFIDKYRVVVFTAGETQEAAGSIGPFPARQPLAWTMGHPLSRVSARRDAPSAYPQVVIALPAILAIAVAIGILLVFAAIAYKIFNGSWGPVALGWGLLLPIALVVGGVYLVTTGAVGRRKPTREAK